jgi:enoyl-CoA hydratase/carnithine racemase
MPYALITVENRCPVALLTLNRPEKLNAWTPPMSTELAEAIENANTDASIGAIVVTGAGRGFCAGADMEATFKTRIDGGDPGANTAAGQGGLPAGLDWVALCRRSKPLVAAVNGAAVGIGLTKILPFDVIVVSTKAVLGMLFVRMGLVPELASTHFLVQRMGFGKASEMCLSGRLYNGDEAFAAGLADHVVAPEQLIDKAFEIAESFASNPDPQLRMIKALLTRNGSAVDLTDVQRSETELLRECWRTPEHAEAVTAFLEKRPPRFR